MKDIRVASVQLHHHAGQKKTNLNKMETFVKRAADQGVRLIVFPEMCITGYWHVRNLSKNEVWDLSEPVPEGPSVQRLLNLASRYDMLIGAGLIEQAGDTLYNSYVVASPAEDAVNHRKLHSFISEYIASGDDFTVFETEQGIKIGILTCYDNNLIENARITALMGAEILLAPHQTGGCDSKSPGAMRLIDVELWENRHENPEAIEAEFRGPKGRGWILRWLPSRAHDNGMYLIFSNGVGRDDNEVRTGNAMILDPYGEIITETWKAGDDMVIADLESDRLPMSTGQRWMQSRRPELYRLLVEKTGREKATRQVRFGSE